MTATPWPKSIPPVARDPLVWNPWMDGIARLYRHVLPGERPAGMAMIMIGGSRLSVLLLEKNGETRRLTAYEAADRLIELENERGEDAGRAGAA